MIVSEIFYGLKCNRCGEQFEDGEHSFWSDESSAIENAIESEWIEEKGKHYCTDCYSFDEQKEDNVPKADFPIHIKDCRQFLSKIIRGYSLRTYEKEDDSIVIQRNLHASISELNENYIKSILGEKLVSYDVAKHERYSCQVLTLIVKS